MTDQDRFDTLARIERAARDNVVVMSGRRHSKTLLTRALADRAAAVPVDASPRQLSMFHALLRRFPVPPFCCGAASTCKKTRFHNGT
ncbi:MAG: hypothetical protein GYB53_22175 [Rhodobacteraceae bacterium]|nr:hypothetical protein [Paracoccaceae bacterium]MBR9823712.1 hypothetical protein [Paracoccaceae bacterium]